VVDRGVLETVASGAKATTEEEVVEAKPAKAAKAPKASASSDDLKKIDGIGPKIADALVAAGIDSFAKLAASSEDDLKAALSGVRAPANVGSWSAQAAELAKKDGE
jgi:large subunit ribosomal protein L21